MNRYRLMTPGPVPMAESVREALARPVLHHRTPEFEKILARVFSRLPDIFQTRERVFLHTATGTGAMESAIVNVLSPGEKVLAIVAGKFGERWADIAESFGLQVVRHLVAWGQDLNLHDTARLLDKHPDTRAVLVQASETSTGAWLPIRELAQLTAKRALLMVDGISAVGAVPMPMDDWGLDVVIAGSQKALMMPTGLSFIAFSAAAMRAVERAKGPRYYWDIRPELVANSKNQTRFSSAVNLIAALDAALEEFHKMGLHHFHREIANRAQATRAGLKSLGLTLFPQTPSPSLTCLCVPDGVDGEKWVSLLQSDYALTVMGGQDQLKGKVLRIGHMGALETTDILASIEALGASLKKLLPDRITDNECQLALKAAAQIK